MNEYQRRSSESLIEELQKYVIVEPMPFVLDLENCHGMWIHTLEGKKIFDWAGFYGAQLLGYNHPGLTDENYQKRLMLAANNKVANPDFLTPFCVDYYRLLYSLAPQCMKNPDLEVYAVNSGAEAVENMMKYLINLHDQKMAHKKKTQLFRRFIYFDQAFHGRTIFALNVTHMEHAPVITRDFHGMAPGHIKAPFPAIDTRNSGEENRRITNQSLEMLEGYMKKYKDEIIGVVVEPIQGAGGHRIAEKRFFQGLSELAHRYDIFLGFDEVQTAGGQTGSVFAVDQLDLPYSPQAIAVAKKFGSGAVYMRSSMEDTGVLDSTWGGHLADMVRVVREFEIIFQEGLLEKVSHKTSLLKEQLEKVEKKYPHLMYNIRGMGLYQGFSVPSPSLKSRLQEIALQQESLLLLGAGPTTIRLRPALIVSEDEIRLFGQKLLSSLNTLAAE